MKRTLIIFLTTLLIIFSLSAAIPTASATSITCAQAVAWANGQLNKALDYDGSYGSQCVDLIYYYYSYLGCSPVGGNACDYAYNQLPAGWQRISVTNGFVPNPGDIAVWYTNHSCGTCITGSYGHVGIITSADSVGFNAINISPSVSSYCSTKWYWLSSLQCVIRPNFASSTPLTIAKTESCKWKVTIPANYRLDLYYNAGDASPTSERWINPKDASYRLTCDEKVTMSDNSVRYHFTSGDGYSVYFKYNSSVMSVEESHNYVLSSTKSATCTSTGYKIYVCSRCSESKEETIYPEGHKYETTYTIDKQPTCTEAGTKSYHCKNCSAKKGSVSIAATGHSWGAWETVQKATTTQNGISQTTCQSCGATERITLAKLPTPEHTHQYSAWVTTKQPTCKTDGQATRKCTSCGANESKVLSATGDHSLKQYETAPTCTAKGETKIVCTTCDYTEIHEIDKIAHSFGPFTVVKEPTETALGLKQSVCANCTEKRTQQIPCLEPSNSSEIDTEIVVSQPNTPSIPSDSAGNNGVTSSPTLSNTASNNTASSDTASSAPPLSSGIVIPDSTEPSDGIDDITSNAETGSNAKKSSAWVWYLAIIPVVAFAAVTGIIYLKKFKKFK